VVAPANYIAWTEQATAFASLAAFGAVSASITGDGEPERVGQIYSTAKRLPMLGVQPLLGRLFEEGEDREGAAPVALLSESFWRRRCGGDAAVVGRTMYMNDRATTIIGILPAWFTFEPPLQFGFTGTTDVWGPFQLSEQHRTWGRPLFQVLARLAPGTTPERTQREMARLAGRLEREVPQRQGNWGINVVPMQEQVTGAVSRALLVVFGAVSFVLLIACANVANLLLFTRDRATAGGRRARRARREPRPHRAAARGGEPDACAVGGGAGLLLASLGVGALHTLAPDIPRLETVSVRLPVLLFAIGVTLLTGALSGTAPIVHVLRSAWRTGCEAAAAKAAGERRDGRATRWSCRAGALLVLLVGAGLLIRSLVRLIATGVGFDTERLLTATVELPAARYPEEVQRAAFYNGLVERVETLPGVEAASAITFAPLSGFGSATYFWANDRPVPQPGEQPTAEIRWDFVLARRVRERVITDVRAALEGTEGRRTAVLAAAPRSSKRSWEPVTATRPSRSGPSPWPRRRDPGCPGP